MRSNNFETVKATKTSTSTCKVNEVEFWKSCSFRNENGLKKKRKHSLILEGQISGGIPLLKQ